MRWLSAWTRSKGEFLRRRAPTRHSGKEFDNIEYGRKYGHMKTTVEMDEAKLERVMALTGLKTRKEAIDWALTEAERIAKIDQIAKRPWAASRIKEAVEPGYDVLAIRKQSVNYRVDS